MENIEIRRHPLACDCTNLLFRRLVAGLVVTERRLSSVETWSPFRGQMGRRSWSLHHPGVGGCWSKARRYLCSCRSSIWIKEKPSWPRAYTSPRITDRDCQKYSANRTAIIGSLNGFKMNAFHLTLKMYSSAAVKKAHNELDNHLPSDRTPTSELQESFQRVTYRSFMNIISESLDFLLAKREAGLIII